jgi:hypothetical protein
VSARHPILGPRRSFELTLGLFGAPFAWTAQLAAGYGLDEARCGAGSHTWGIGGTDSQAVVFVAALIVAAAATLAAAVSWRSGQAPGDDRGRVPFLAKVAVLTCVLFDILIVLTGVYVLSLEACRQA